MHPAIFSFQPENVPDASSKLLIRELRPGILPASKTQPTIAPQYMNVAF
jgi:hypothetical protein